MKELTLTATLQLNQQTETSYSFIFNRYYPGLFRFVIKITESKEEAEDIVLKSFQKLFECYPAINTDENIRAFLFIVARNDSLNYRNSQRIHRRMCHYFSWTTEQTKTYYPLEKKDERIEPVKAAIGKLPTVCQKIIRMLFYEEMKTTEVAAALNLAISTVHNQKNRGIQLLRKQLVS